MSGRSPNHFLRDFQAKGNEGSCPALERAEEKPRRPGLFGYGRKRPEGTGKITPSKGLILRIES